MLTKIINAIIAAIKSVFGIKDPPTEPSIAEVTAQATANADQVKQEEAANDILQKGSAARSTATAGIVRDTANAPTADPATSTSTNDTLKRDFPQDFRD